MNDAGWSIIIPAANVLGKAAKQYFERELAADPEAVRRFNMTFDIDLIKKLTDRVVYFEVNDWVNKSLNIRDVGVMFDEPDKKFPDFMIRIWTPADSLFEFMCRFFPWLDYEYLEIIEALDGDVEVHSIEVSVNELGKQFIDVENYFVNGPPERAEPNPPGWGEIEQDPDWEDHATHSELSDAEVQELLRRADQAGI